MKLRGWTSPSFQTLLAVLALSTIVVGTTGCLGPLLATGIYVAQGGNMAPAAFKGLKDKKVVVVCRPPSSHEYRHAGAARGIATRVSRMIDMNVPGVTVVDQKEVDNWIDENDWSNGQELAKAVQADMLVQIELDDFQLHQGRTLYQGRSHVLVSVYDIEQGGKLKWERRMGEILYPKNSGIPAQDKSVASFQREFEDIVSLEIATLFYKHDPTVKFGQDALANR